MPSSLAAAPPFRIAVITTEYRHESHADVIVSRWIKPFPKDARYGWKNPTTTIASIYAHQIPENDMSRQICDGSGIRHCASIAEALTFGTDRLAVDAVLLIGEHGNYPLNALGQKLYPRKELFDDVVQVFRECGAVVPVFFDKHLSWDPEAIQEMYWTIRDMEIPFFGGSSLTHCPVTGNLGVHADRPEEVVAITWNSLEAYLFHSLEITRAFLEGTESASVASMVAWRDEGLWDALDAGAFSNDLLETAAAAISPDALAAIRETRANRGHDVYAFQLHHENGLKETHFRQSHGVRKWSLACRFEDGTVEAGAVEAGGRDEGFPHFARLNRKIEDFFRSGVAPISLDRLYWSSMATAEAMAASAEPGKVRATPRIQSPVLR